MTVAISPVSIWSIPRERVSPASFSEMNAILCPVGDQAGSITWPSTPSKSSKTGAPFSSVENAMTSPVASCARTLSPWGDQSTVGSLGPRLAIGVAADSNGASTRFVTDPAASTMMICGNSRPLDAPSRSTATACPSGDGSIARIVEPPGAWKSSPASPSLAIDQTSLPDTTKTTDAAPRTARRSVNEVGVAIDSAVGRSDGEADATASVGARVGLGSVANWGPASSSAHATSKQPATSAARHAEQLPRERLIGPSQEVQQVRPIPRQRDQCLGYRPRPRNGRQPGSSMVPSEEIQPEGHCSGLSTRPVYNRKGAMIDSVNCRRGTDWRAT